MTLDTTAFPTAYTIPGIPLKTPFLSDVPMPVRPGIPSISGSPYGIPHNIGYSSFDKAAPFAFTPLPFLKIFLFKYMVPDNV